MEKVDEWVLALSSDGSGEIGLYRVYFPYDQKGKSFWNKWCMGTWAR